MLNRYFDKIRNYLGNPFKNTFIYSQYHPYGALSIGLLLSIYRLYPPTYLKKILIAFKLMFLK